MCADCVDREVRRKKPDLQATGRRKERWKRMGKFSSPAKQCTDVTLPEAARSGGGTAAPRAVSWKALGRACVLPSVSTFAFRFPLSPAASRSQAVSPKTRGTALPSSRLPPEALGRLLLETFQRLTVGTSSIVPHPGRALGCSPESTQPHKVFVRVFGLRMY